MTIRSPVSPGSTGNESDYIPPDISGQPPGISLTAHHLRFTLRADTPLRFDAFKGSSLRGAWQSHLRTLYCPNAGDAGRDPLHESLCPVCYLLSREAVPGEDRRPYAFEPPLETKTFYPPGEEFSFGMTLYGSAANLFVYLMLAVNEMGQRQGIGRPIGPGERGRAHVERIEEVNPFSGVRRILFEPGAGRMAQAPAAPVTGPLVEAAADELQVALWANGGRLAVRFLTPTRITQAGELQQQVAFRPFFQRLAERVIALAGQYGGGEPPVSLKDELLPLADRVVCLADHTRWADVKGYSSRLGRAQPLGGWVGQAVFQLPQPQDWRPLLTWLLWGVSTHAGKNIVKGCGWFDVRADAGG